jgi:hypothetical protein
MKRILVVMSGGVSSVLIIIRGILAGQYQTRPDTIPIKNIDVSGFAEL